MSIISLNSGTQAHFMAQGNDVQSSINLDKLSDVTVTNVADNQVLKSVSYTHLTLPTILLV